MRPSPSAPPVRSTTCGRPPIAARSSAKPKASSWSATTSTPTKPSRFWSATPRTPTPNFEKWPSDSSTPAPCPTRNQTTTDLHDHSSVVAPAPRGRRVAGRETLLRHLIDQVGVLRLPFPVRVGRESSVLRLVCARGDGGRVSVVSGLGASLRRAGVHRLPPVCIGPTVGHLGNLLAVAGSAAGVSGSRGPNRLVVRIRGECWFRPVQWADP